MVLNFLGMAAGLALLIFGADYLVKGASSIAKKMQIPAIVIGLTIVAFGTSMPELVVNILAAINNQPGLAFGNILGSNIANILLILGISALVFPMQIQRNTVWKEIPFALLASVILLILCNDVFLDGATSNIFSRSDGLVLIGFFGIFMAYIVSLARSEQKSDGDDVKEYNGFLSAVFCIGGIVALYFGGDLLVNNATFLARNLGLSEALIGLTIVAVGTSLPELFTSVIAAIRRQSDIAVGNIVGSNIFNIFWILGVTGLIQPMAFDSPQNIDIFIATATTILLFMTVFFRPHKLQKAHGFLFLGAYIAYLACIVMRG